MITLYVSTQQVTEQGSGTWSLLPRSENLDVGYLMNCMRRGVWVGTGNQGMVMCLVKRRYAIMIMETGL